MYKRVIIAYIHNYVCLCVFVFTVTSLPPPINRFLFIFCFFPHLFKIIFFFQKTLTDNSSCSFSLAFRFAFLKTNPDHIFAFPFFILQNVSYSFSLQIYKTCFFLPSFLKYLIFTTTYYYYYYFKPRLMGNW